MNGHDNPGLFARWRTSFWRVARPVTPHQEPWRRLALRLHYDLPAPDRSRSAMLVTVGGGELAAQACLELAAGLADELGKPILVVDAAPRERSLTRLLNCAGRAGLTDVLFDTRTALGDILLPTTHPNVRFVAAGGHPDLVEHAAAERAGPVIEALQNEHEIVLFCGGAVPANALALALAPLVDCVLLFAAEDETMIEDFDAAQEALRIRRVRDIGLVVATRSGDLR
jgi:hypothetical protein